MRNSKNTPVAQLSYNHNSRIRTRITRNGKLRTETQNREDLFNVAVSTTPRTDSTRFFIDSDEGSIALNGRQARTVFRALLKHYQECGKSLPE
jgi:hypothetical protein